MHRSEFLMEAKALFPPLREALNHQYGLLSLEMRIFQDFTQRAIDEGRREDVVQAFRLAERVLAHGSSDLVSTLHISFLEELSLEDGKARRAWARPLMPESLAMGYARMQAYLQDAAEARRPRKAP